jgi:hypothetical protein
MIQLNWDDSFNQTPEFNRYSVRIGSQWIDLGEALDFGTTVGVVRARDLKSVFAPYENTSCRPQLALLVYAALRRPRALNGYFPLTSTLDIEAQGQFYRLAGDMVKHNNPKVRLMGEDGRDYLKSRSETAFFVACQIVEVFFHRQDILKRLTETAYSIWLYTTPKAFQKDGGTAGGNYSPYLRGIQLVQARLYEGFNGKTPGVAPFLHEFGHLLDHFDASQGDLRGSMGLLPGMRPEEGAIFSAETRDLFLKGKQIELERYLHLHGHDYEDGDALPLGHPYVFQNDTEFIAGYFEMFFRNPHTFAAQNPDLYEAFRLTFGYDPRKVWAEDFPFYVEQNRTFYRTQRPPKPGLNV